MILLFYCIFDQINAPLERIRDFFKKKNAAQSFGSVLYSSGDQKYSTPGRISSVSHVTVTFCIFCSSI